MLLLWSAWAAACEPTLERWTVRGTSMTGLVEDGDVVTVATTCFDVARGDWVLFRPAGRDAPVLKAVRAVAGDTVALVDGARGAAISVNGAVLTTPDRGPYQLDPAATSMLALYVDSYGGRVPAGAVLLLGTDPAGALDSTRVGFVAVVDLLGEVVAVDRATPTAPAQPPSATPR